MSEDWWVWLVIGFLLGGGSVWGVFWWFLRTQGGMWWDNP